MFQNEFRCCIKQFNALCVVHTSFGWACDSLIVQMYGEPKTGFGTMVQHDGLQPRVQQTFHPGNTVKLLLLLIGLVFLICCCMNGNPYLFQVSSGFESFGCRLQVNTPHSNLMFRHFPCRPNLTAASYMIISSKASSKVRNLVCYAIIVKIQSKTQQFCENNFTPYSFFNIYSVNSMFCVGVRITQKSIKLILIFYTIPFFIANEPFSYR